MRVNVAKRRDLQGLVADVVQLFRRLSKIGFVLRIVADGEALCTDDHENSSQKSDYTPEYAEKPPSTGIVMPVTKPDASLSMRKRSVPSSSSGSPKRPIGVCEMIL